MTDEVENEAGAARRLAARSTSLDIEAQGVARRPDGKVVFIEGALPFELVSGQRQPHEEQLGAGHAHGDAPRVVAARAAALPAFRPARRRLRRLQDAAPARRRRRWPIKQRVLEDNLWHLGKVKAETVLRPIEGPTWGYR